MHNLARSLRRPGVAFAASCGGVAGAFSTIPSSAEPKVNLYDMVARLEKKVENLQNEVSSLSYASGRIIDQLFAAKESHPSNLSAKHFDMGYYDALPAELKPRFLKMVQSGAENADSGMGVYAMYPDDYEVFEGYLGGVIAEYHKIAGTIEHTTNWNLKNIPGLPADGKLDLAKLGLPVTSMRVRVGRNLQAFPLPGAMTKDDRINMERSMIHAFEQLMADPNYGGTYHSLTPGTKYSINEAKYQELVDAHVMFKDMAADPYLASAGISSNWPVGRGCYVSGDKQFIVWVGEEDHLRIMCMKKGLLLNEVFDRLSGACGVVEKASGKFAHSPKYGYVTSCPTNLGTGMRASLHIALPNLTANGSDVSQAKKVCKSLGLSVRGVGGEHTAAGAGGIVDISPSARLCIQEAEIVTALYKGVEKLIAEEKR